MHEASVENTSLTRGSRYANATIRPRLQYRIVLNRTSTYHYKSTVLFMVTVGTSADLAAPHKQWKTNYNRYPLGGRVPH